MNKNLKISLLSFATVFLWASAFPLTKIAMTALSPNALASVRCIIAAALLLCIGMVKGIQRPKSRKDFLYFLLSGGMGFALYMTTFNIGIQTLTSATSSIIIAVTPIMTAIVADRLYKEKIKPIGWLCIITAFLGVVVLLLWDGILSINAGLIWTICAALVFCGYNILNRKLSAMGYTSLECVTYSMICGAALLLLFLPQGITEVAAAEPIHILSVVYLGIMPSALAYLLWGQALAMTDKTSSVTNFMFVTPLLSAVMGFLLLNEIPNAGTFIGGTVIIGSIVLFSLKGK